MTTHARSVRDAAIADRVAEFCGDRNLPTPSRPDIREVLVDSVAIGDAALRAKLLDRLQ